MGPGATAARYRVAGSSAVRHLLGALVEADVDSEVPGPGTRPAELAAGGGAEAVKPGAPGAE